MAIEPEKDNFQVIKIEIVARNEEAENVRDALIEYLLLQAQVFILANENRELEENEWEEMQSEVSPEFFDDSVELDDDDDFYNEED